jgi:hypothetical protein
MPGRDEKTYSYNLFTYNLKKEIYYFVAIISFKITNNDVKMKAQYLFTENNSLNRWWRTMFTYYQSDLIKNIPEKYLYKICPPLPNMTDK